MLRLDLNEAFFTEGKGVFTSNPDVFIVARLTFEPFVVEYMRKKDMPRDTYSFRVQDLDASRSNIVATRKGIPNLQQLLIYMCKLIRAHSNGLLSIRPGWVSTQISEVEVLEELHALVIEKSGDYIVPQLVVHTDEAEDKRFILFGAKCEEQSEAFSQEERQEIRSYLFSYITMLNSKNCMGVAL